LADKYIDDLYDSVKKLEDFPVSCAPCKNEKLREKGYRCCSFKSHIIIYNFQIEEVNILVVIHSKRNLSSIEVV
jgi:plasmid stabilization system protein ParE